MAKTIMLQGTMSDVGKSVITAGLCRILKRDGYRVAPFKSQNMALNSFVTRDGYEMGRAQAMQAAAAGIAPDVRMNPVLLKPTGHMSSQVIVMGEIRGEMSASEYYDYKDELMAEVLSAYESLAKENDVIVIEGAGSAAEINLKDKDIVNMGLAKALKAPVCLVGDIDRGGVFAQLYGTVELLEEDERRLVKGLIINKFRGDKKLLDPGLLMIEEKLDIPVLGVVNYMDLKLEDEDSLSRRLISGSAGDLWHSVTQQGLPDDRGALQGAPGVLQGAPNIDIAVIRFPYISNFTDLNVFDQIREVSVRYVNSPEDMGTPDMLVLPGSKNTNEDMRWLFEKGFAPVIRELAEEIPVFGICGGFQMLGRSIRDESAGGDICEGLGFFEHDTVIKNDKIRRQVSGRLDEVDGLLSGLSRREFEGYEIHMGRTFDEKGEDVNRDGKVLFKAKGVQVYGTYVHGIFDRARVLEALVNALGEKKGVRRDLSDLKDHAQFMVQQFDLLADEVAQSLDMKKVYEIIGIGKKA